MQEWMLSHSCEQETRKIADRHYNRQKPGTPRFVPPGRCLVLLSVQGDAFWVTSFPYAKYVKHAWAGAFVCSAFRNEGKSLSSKLILEAVAITRWKWPDVPDLGMITFVDAGKVRHKRKPGWCYHKAGFKHVGFTKRNNLWTWQMLPEEMPDPLEPIFPPERSLSKTLIRVNNLLQSSLPILRSIVTP